MKRIAIVGPESSGKSTLAKALAGQFLTAWAPEYARSYLDIIDRPYEEKDLLTIAKGQLALEETMATHANEWLFCDTNLLVIRIWAEYKYKRVDPWIVSHEGLDRYDLHVLTRPDIPWEDDPLREHPHHRDTLFPLYETALQEAKVPYVIISGENRLDQAVEAISDL
ncbi:MAG: ATP-binding protein [Bacteroidota bacterium]